MTRRLCPEDSYPQALLAVAGYGMAAARRQFPDSPLTEESWSAVLNAARAHRMTGLLQAAIDDGAFPTTETQTRQAQSAQASAMFWVLTLEQELLGIIDLLTEVHVPTRVLKGTGVAYLDYSRPELRPFIDVDVLVPAGDFDRAVQTLLGAGFIRRLQEPRPGFDRRFDKGTTLVGRSGYELDLHRTFALGPWGLRVNFDELWNDGGQEVVVAGRRLRALSHDHRLLHACYHATLGDWPLRLASLRDVAEMVLATGQAATDIQTLAARWRVEGVVAAAIADTWRLLGISTSTELSAWAQCYVPSRQDEANLNLYTHPNKTFTAQALSTVRALPRMSDKAAYIRALVLPDAKYVAGRHHSAVARFRYAIREARRGRGEPV